MVTRIAASTALLSMAAMSLAHAQGVASDQLIDSITVTGAREHLELDVPAPTASKTAEDLRAQNLVNPEDALKYVPNLTIRKRYIGDRNALIGGRSFSTLQAPRGLVLMDGYLLSNFLGRFDAPRWNMISPEEIDRVDVLYGPFSALYPGNSIGTTVQVRTRRPEQRELSVRTTAFGESFDQYGSRDDFAGYQASAFFGDRFDNGAWLTLAANRQDSTGHPMQYFTVSANGAGQFPAVPSNGATPVTGVVFDTDPFGNPRAVFGANAGAIDHTVQNQWKLRGGYALTDWLEAEGFVAEWRNDTDNENRTFMRDASGQPVWQGPVIADGIAFNVPATALAPSTREERHLQWGTTVRTTRESGWNGSVVYSQYRIADDSTLQANTPDPVAASGGPGTNSERDGTGWHTLELQGVYTPVDGDWTNGKHTLAFGYHRNDYRLTGPVYETTDWRQRAGTLVQDVHGETSLQALYAQDAWALAERWVLTLGVRYEDWQASDGLQFVRGAAPEVYPSRTERTWSPKASLAFRPHDAWQVRFSAGRGVRFPTVAELFLGTVTSTQITRNDPNLAPEVSDALDLSVEYQPGFGRVRVSLFQDDIRDTIWNQVNVFVFPSRNTVQNVDRVRTRGIETAFGIDRVGIATLAVEGSIAYARARILENDNHPDYVGNAWPRVPDWRGNVQAVWRPSPAWLASLGFRYSSKTFGRLENDDFNGDTYGGISRVQSWDGRVAYTTLNGTELAVGIDNITNDRTYQSHPYPSRTAFAEVRWSLGGAR
ncbi:MAG TPA: TonB-dependent receptor [Steroidobacteraceae bacterium]|nr:TonB-dependent receptor [Steroidobacteraceae bacterium]